MSQITNDAEYRAVIRHYRKEARELIPPSLRVIKRAIEDPDPRKAAANLRRLEKSLGIINLRERTAEIYRKESQREKSYESGTKRHKTPTHTQASRPR